MRQSDFFFYSFRNPNQDLITKVLAVLKTHSCFHRHTLGMQGLTGCESGHGFERLFWQGCYLSELWMLLSCLLMNSLQLEHHDSHLSVSAFLHRLIIRGNYPALWNTPIHSTAIYKVTFHTWWLFSGWHDICNISPICIRI